MLASLPAQLVNANHSLSTLTCRKDTAIIQAIEPSSCFIGLPPELWTTIFLQMDARTIVRCCAVCHRFKGIIQASMELQYWIELAADGMVDGLPSSLTVRERLTRLREPRQSWATLQWSSRISVPMSGPFNSLVLVGGVLFKTGYFMPYPFSERHLTVTWLPSALDPQACTHVRENAWVSTLESAVDPSQDLIIYFTGGHTNLVQMSVASGPLEMHVRTISTNEDHPEARLPTLCMSVLHNDTFSSIQIADDIVCIWSRFAGDNLLHITLWNWKTGKFITNHSTICALFEFWDFTVISSRAFIITTRQKAGTIEIFTFDGDPTESEQPVDDPLLLTASSSAHQSTASKFVIQPKSNVTHVASLQLPATHPHVWVDDLSVHVGPFVARPPTGRPFVAANEENIYFFSVRYVNANPHSVETSTLQSRMFLKHNTLERYIRKYKSGSGAGEERSTAPLAVPWEEWGRENTRFMVHHWTEERGFRYIHGHRVHGHRVVLPAPATRNEGSMVHVLDFNVCHAVWQSQCNPPDKDDTVDTPKAQPIMLQPPRELHATSKHPRLITEPSVENHPSFFPEPVETTLPYCEVWYEPEEDYFSIMIDEERIVCVRRPLPNGELNDVHVFTM
ncbi:hypothetical protein PISMIDRAFT_254243 [Pisolithus microcarpus 441]|uniref:F-box domain-containing protein n=1 Tax=Pisolithus microcarpus 441 TaxID=765257 RepID=A0A0C9YS33_9AGAM|nr:hypothetical protein PISMIDRAFT_254243 [Pisolithus microcarpus 441]